MMRGSTEGLARKGEGNREEWLRSKSLMHSRSNVMNLKHLIPARALWGRPRAQEPIYYVPKAGTKTVYPVLHSLSPKHGGMHHELFITSSCHRQNTRSCLWISPEALPCASVSIRNKRLLLTQQSTVEVERI